MIDTALIDQLFIDAISKPRIYKKLGVTARTVTSMRYNFKHLGRVRFEKKIWVLQKLGIAIDTFQYKKTDLVDLLHYYQRCSAAAKALGPEYVVEKFLDKERKLSGRNKP